ncbi:MAG: DNA recombination protein RmuC [Patescibacteria group bacterium]
MGTTVIIIIAVLIGFIGVAVFVAKKLKSLEEKQKGDQSLLMLNQNLQGMQARIDETTRAINERLDNAAKVVAGVAKELGAVQEMGRGMKDLQDFLRSPKLRGNIGEQVLRDLLEQYFPREHFELQYTFQSGERVDAILKTDKGLIPIDSKFPMENFAKILKAESDGERDALRREFVKDVKKHVDAIAKKYILPQEGTVDFAVMYVPSESVYYEIIRDEGDLNNYANGRKVFLVSPNSFFYFLKVIMMGMEGKRIEEQAKRILELLIAMQQDAGKFGETLGVVTTHVTNAKNAVDRANTEYMRLAGKIEQVRMLK